MTLPRAAWDATVWPRPHRLPTVALGVKALVLREPDRWIIPVVASLDAGKGHVGRWLDTLPTDLTVVFTDPLGGYLDGMLERRGFWYVQQWAPVIEMGEWLDAYVRTNARAGVPSHPPGQ